jgi:hypothetical protein
VYLEIKETVRGQCAVLWRTPVLAGMRLPLALKMPDGVTEQSQAHWRTMPQAVLLRTNEVISTMRARLTFALATLVAWFGGRFTCEPPDSRS